MGYTFVPKENCAKAFGNNLSISSKDAKIICAVIRGKKLSTVRRLLNDIVAEKRSLKGKYYTFATTEILQLLESCAANARSKGMDEGKLFVHASAHHGGNFQRRRRKAKYGSHMKRTHVELMLLEKVKGNDTPERKQMEKSMKEKTVVRTNQRTTHELLPETNVSDAHKDLKTPVVHEGQSSPKNVFGTPVKPVKTKQKEVENK